MDFDQVAVNGANSNHIKKGGVIMASTIRAVAARAGLSVGTVSKYSNGKTVKESTRLAIEEAIKELDFHPKNKYLYLSLNGKNNYVKQTGSYLFLLFRFWSWQFIIHRMKINCVSSARPRMGLGGHSHRTFDSCARLDLPFVV